MTDTYALTQGLPFDGERFLPGHAVLIRGRRIQAVCAEVDLEPHIARIPLQGAVVAPGFIDLQVNGGGGVLFNDAITTATLESMRETCLKGGCLSFLPTLISASDEDMLEAMSVAAAFRSSPENADAVLGLHLEGPYISKTRKGIHDERFIRPPDPEMVGILAEFARHTPLLLTLAPECVRPEDIHFLVAAGVRVSIGHSAATFEQAKAAIKAGAHLATHLFNGMPPWQSREPGIVAAIFDSPDCACGMIADGYHAHFASLALAKRLKGDACFLVTDAGPIMGGDMANAAGMTDTERMRDMTDATSMTGAASVTAMADEKRVMNAAGVSVTAGMGVTEFQFGGQTVYVRDGMCVNADGVLAGSMLAMMQAVRNGVTRIGWEPAEVLRMASLYPARIMGVSDRLGILTAGAVANLALFHPHTYDMVAVVEQGRLRMLR